MPSLDNPAKKIEIYLVSIELLTLCFGSFGLRTAPHLQLLASIKWLASRGVFAAPAWTFSFIEVGNHLEMSDIYPELTQGGSYHKAHWNTVLKVCLTRADGDSSSCSRIQTCDKKHSNECSQDAADHMKPSPAKSSAPSC